MKTKTLLVLEKPSQLMKLEESNEFQNLKNTKDIFVHYAHCVIPYYVFDYPKNKKYSDYPNVYSLQFKMKIPLIESVNDYNVSYKNLNKEFLSQFEEIIIGTDPDHSGVFGAINEIEQVFNDNISNVFETIYFLNLKSINSLYIDEEIKSLFNDKLKQYKNLKLMDYLFNYGSVKRYFEFNYQLNLNIFIKELYKYIFLQDFKDNKEFEETYSQYGITKYMLLTLFLLKDKEPLNLNKIINIMYKHKGTGKYKNNNCFGIGSPASSSYILENLIKLNLLVNEKKNYKISDKGLLFLNLLNKKMFDPDLPFRLDDWCDKAARDLINGDSPIIQKIDNYILNVFKSQKRKNKYLKKD